MEKFYNDFYKEHGIDSHESPERFDKIASLCQGKTLDIGCGTGSLSDYFLGEYVGFDFSSEAILLAKRHRRSDAVFEVRDCSDFANIPFESFDTIVFAEFLEHIYNDDLIFDQIKARGKAGQRLIISVPNGDKVPDVSHVRTFTIPELRKKFSSLGHVKFYNWIGASNRIIMSVDLCESNPDLLSLVMIVKNEELGLENAILSCLDFCDNIVVAVDSQTTDKTEVIARQYADVLKKYDWKDSFAAARNEAQEGVKSKWILALDGHEYIKSFENLDKMLLSEADGLLVSVELETGSIIHYPRIYKNGFTFISDVHNLIQIKTRADYPEFIIVHDRKNLQSKEAAAIRKKQRDDMIPRIMGERLKRNKKDVRALFYLALFYQTANKLDKTIDYYKKYLKYATWKGERWLVCFNLSIAFYANNKIRKAIKYAKLAEKELPNRWEVSKLLGMLYYAKMKYKKALVFLVDSFKVNTGEFSYKPWVRDDADTWNLIGQTFFNLRDLKNAKIAFEEALKNCTKLDEVRPSTNPKYSVKQMITERIQLVKRLLEI